MKYWIINNNNIEDNNNNKKKNIERNRYALISKKHSKGYYDKKWLSHQ